MKKTEKDELELAYQKAYYNARQSAKDKNTAFSTYPYDLGYLAALNQYMKSIGYTFAQLYKLEESV